MLSAHEELLRTWDSTTPIYRKDEMTNFNIYRANTNDFYKMYDEIVSSVAESLRDLGHLCNIGVNQFIPSSVNILIGHTMFASRYHSLPEKLRDQPYIVYQFEQLDDSQGLLPDWPEYWELLKGATVVWDYSPSGTQYLKSRGLKNVYYVPPGFHRVLECFRPNQSPDIDVLFIGTPYPRRLHIANELENRGLKVVNLSFAFGERRNRYIKRSKIVLNTHIWDGMPYLETVRLSFLLANRSFVISEEGDHNPYEGGVVYGNYQALPDLCDRFLQEEKKVREQIAEKGYLSIRKLDMVNILRDVLEDQNFPADEKLILSTASQNASHYPQDHHNIASIVPKHAEKILDIGCAEGHVGADIKKRQLCHVTGIEISPDASLRAAQALDLVICGDALNILPSLPDQHYDSIIMLDTLEHISDCFYLLKLAEKKLSKNGILIVRVLNIAYWANIKQLMTGRWEYSEQHMLGRTYFRLFTRTSLVRLLQEAGFEIMKQTAVRLPDSAPPSVLIEAAKQISFQESTTAYRQTLLGLPSELMEVAKQMRPQGIAVSYLEDYKYIFVCRKFE
jgi:2-polyprenyl-3-methyl-5-hydroxy-6-metoxy-1,4-benzoquinol methylase